MGHQSFTESPIHEADLTKDVRRHKAGIYVAPTLEEKAASKLKRKAARRARKANRT